MRHKRLTVNRHLLLAFLALSLSLGIFLFLSDPVAGGRLESAGDDDVRLTAADDGHRVDLSEDQILSITLEGNPSTGYTWMIDQADRQFVRQVGEAEFSPQSELIGAPGKVTLRFRMVRAGSTALRLVYRRPWEDRPPERTFSVALRGVGEFAPVDDLSDLQPTLMPPAEPLSPQDLAPSDRVPSYYNWCDQGACTPVKNQSSCGSCWAFATAGVFESSLRIHDNVTRDLAEQYLVSCNTHGWGCNGGSRAFDYYLDRVPSGEPDAGAVYESDFPYTAADDPCNPPHSHYEKIISWSYGSSTVADIQQMIYDYGPVYVSVCAGNDFQSYGGGVFEIEESSECGGWTNHAVILVGWDDNQGTNGVWYLKNSWSTGWGESGYMRIGYGISNVGTNPAYVVYGEPGDVGPLVYNSHVIDDDANGESVGDNDGVVECGETIELFVDLRNQGGSAAAGVDATLSTSDPYASIIYNTSSAYPDIAGGGTGTNASDWDFTVDAATPDGHMIDFDLDITAGNGGPWTDSFSIPVTCITCNDPYEDNDAPGQATVIAYGDTLSDPDICAAGDVDYYAFTGSAGDEIVADIDAQSIGSDLDPYLFLYDTDGVTELAQNDDSDGLDSRLEYTLPDDGTYYLMVREFSHGVEGGPGYFYTLSLTGVSTVGPIVYDGHTVDDDTSGESDGDDDGVVECGETIELYVDLLNQGGGTATGLNATLSTTDPYVSTFLFNDDSSYPDLVGSGRGTNSNDWDFTVDAGTPDGHWITFDLDVTGTNGGPWSDSFSVPVTCMDSQAEWTFLVYLDADNNLEGAGIDDFFELSSVGSTGDVNVVVQFDRISGYDTTYGDWTDTRRFFVTPGLTPLDTNGTSIGEANMGDPQTLVDFVQWGVTNYPADRYAVIVWDHGSGWLRAVDPEPIIKSVASDSTDGDALTMPELRSAMSTLSNGGADPLDLVGFDACLMAMAEVDNQLIPYVNVRVGSEETEPWDGWSYAPVLTALTANPTMSAAQLGTEIVDEYYASYGSSETQSAVDLGSAYATLNTAIDDFAAALIAGVDTHHVDIVSARGSTQEFYYPTFVDLYDFAYQVNQSVSDATINSAATAVMNAVDAAVIHEQHGATWPGAHGISIYFPEFESSYSSTYDGSQGFLQFTATTRWDEWLHAFYSGGSCGDPHEINDAPGQATSITYGDTVTDPDICPVGDWDYYAFAASASDVITVDIDARSIGSDLDPFLYLYDTDGVTELTHNDDYDGFDSYLEYTLPADGTYYLGVREYLHGSEGGANYFYTLSLSGASRSAGPLVFDGYAVDDDPYGDSIGNGDGIPNPGETVELYVSVRNDGLGAATGVTATLSTNDSYISSFIHNTGSNYADIEGGGTGINSNDWDFTIDPLTPDGHQVTFCLDPILDGEGQQWADCFTLTVAETRSVYLPLVIREGG